MTQQENTKIKTSIAVLLFIFTWFFVYAFLHEAGHALVGIAYGGTIESFVFWDFNAHVVIVGANYGVFGEALMNAAGPLLPRVLFAIAIGFYTPKIKFPGYHICYFTALLSLVAGALMGWVIIPIRSMFTLLYGEDSLSFLRNTGFHPVLIALLSLLLICALVFFAHSKRILTGAWAALNSLVGKEIAVKNNKTRWGIVSIGFMLSAAVVFVAAMHVPYAPANIFRASVEISDVRTESNRTYTFTADGARHHRFYLDVHGQGVVTGFIVENNAGNRYFSWAFEETSRVFGLGLSEGVYNIRFIFLTSFEAVTDFLKEISSYEHVGSDDIQSFREVFYRSSGDYSVSYSLRIR